MNDIRWFISICNNKNFQQIKKSSKTNNYNINIISAFNNKNLVLISKESAIKIESYSNSNIDVLFQGFIWDKNKLWDSLNENDNLADLSQAQLILSLYRKYDENFVKNIKGIFFIIIWDRRKNIVLCYRDRMGFVPFFYTLSEGNYTFSTTIKGLLLNSSVKKICNRAALADHLRHRWPKEEETFYEGITRLRQGHKLSIKDNYLKTSNYWDINQKWIEDNWVTGDIKEKFESILEKSIKNSLEIGKNSIFLSGGLDSVSVGAYLSRICEENYNYKPLALSLHFTDPECDEEVVQRSISKSLSMPHYITALNNAYGSDNLFQKSLDFNNKLSSPLLNFWVPGYSHLVEKAKSEGNDVILTGGGGDEWLGVNPYYMADLIKSYDYKGIYRFLRNYHLSFDTTRFNTFYYSLYLFGLKPLIARQLDILSPGYWKANRKNRYINSYPNWIAPDKTLKDELLSRSCDKFEYEEHKRIPNGKYGYYLRNIEEQYSHVLTSWEMEENYEYAQSMNITLFHPYWDSDMIEFLACIKPETLNAGGRSKGIIRNLMTEKFHNIDFKNQKKINSVNYYFKTLRDNFGDIEMNIKDLNSLSELEIVERNSVKHLFNKVQIGKKQSEIYRLWDICNAEKWLINNF